MKKKSSQGKYTIGIDIGGTKIAFALVDTHGKIKKYFTEPTHKDTPQHFTQQLSSGIAKISKGILPAKITGIGLASAGPIDLKRGLLVYPSNFHGWKVVPIVQNLKKDLRKRFRIHLPIFFQNDAVAAALGEGWKGKAKDCTTYIIITVGTGIGTGVIFEGKPLQSRGHGSEWGVQLIQHSQLQTINKDFYFASVEGFASGTAILRRAQSLGFQGHSIPELLWEMKNLKNKSRKQKYLNLFNDASTALAILCYNLSLGIYPQKIVFTGGLMQAYSYFFPAMLRKYKKMIQYRPHFYTPIFMSSLKGNAGILGAARLPRL